MAVGSYGTIRPADVSPEDVEIILHYTSDRAATTTPSHLYGLLPIFYGQHYSTYFIS